MRRLFGSIGLFWAGVFAGQFLLRPAPAQQDRLTGLHLNHVGIATNRWDETLNFYQKTLGFPEAFTFKDKDGNVTTSYIQFSRENFLEIAHAAAGAASGVSHVGIQVDDLKGTITRLRERGIKVEDPRIGNSKAPLTNIVDPNGIRIELLEYPSDSLQKKAIDSYR